MHRLIDTSESSGQSGQAATDGAPRVDVCFPEIEEMLQRLARAGNEKRHSKNSLLFGSWTMTAAAVAVFICVPGCATATLLLMKYQNFDTLPVSAQGEQVLAKADRLPPIEPIDAFNRSDEQVSPPISEMFQDKVLSESVALRGTIENAVFKMPDPGWLDPGQPAPNKSGRRRNPNRATLPKLAVEPPNPPIQQPSVLEKLFNEIVSVTQLSGNHANVKQEEYDAQLGDELRHQGVANSAAAQARHQF